MNLLGTSPITRSVTGAPGTGAPANTIFTFDAANPGNVAVSTAGQVGFAGIGMQASGRDGTVLLQTFGDADIILGTGGATAGDQLISDGSGNAVKVTLNPAGVTTIKQVIGTAVITGVAGDIIPVHLQPYQTVV